MAATEFDRAKLRRNIGAALSNECRLSEEAANEAAFHLTDWREDLRGLTGLYAMSEWDAKQASELIVSFLQHVPAHVAAAVFIVTGQPVTDIFELGAVQGSGRGTREPGEPNLGDES